MALITRRPMGRGMAPAREALENWFKSVFSDKTGKVVKG
jgi:hypothetical protein